MAVLTEEQQMLRDGAQEWVSKRAPVSAFRATRDSGAVFDPALWKEIAEMGWAGMVVPEAQGGSDFGLTGMGLVLEEMGKTLVASPLFISGLVAASAIKSIGNDAQKADWLTKIADGSAIVTLAIDEGTRHNTAQTAMQAQADGDGFTLSGTKVQVIEGIAADAFLVLARTSGAAGDTDGLTLFLVPANSAGITRTQLKTFDSRGHAKVVFDGVKVGKDAVVGTIGGAHAPLEKVLDVARVGIACEMLGLCQQAFDTTLEYLKTRVQFNTILAQFQALQHRMADLFMELQLARSVIEHAVREIDAGGDGAEEAAILAKGFVGDVANKMSRQMIQLHGGIGMTDQYDAGFYIKRSRVLEATFGNQSQQSERWANLHDY
ncbi:acyl-CoA dehydrogenase family protein [Pseudooceanicola sp.]|uniref:acyl-CoA dehydrogenase family protein n=1 Tax=Pseudooceanicola sp. TaxID=1914328 RepID=UPI002638D473|nr:acyl-CoA dehydrogenase family protein [Pseudooceanicola sp.]MDF1856117.1 acyl-CoA/acyl-ACP dehydrogenase [Pseudooceanicola sp.]